jgi:hypothetical protein
VTTHYLGKWAETLKEGIEIPLKDTFGQLNIHLIEVKRIPGFSTNKIPASKKRDLYLEFTEKQYNSMYGAAWSEGQEGLVPHKTHYDFTIKRKLYFIPIKQIHDFKGEYRNGNNPAGAPALQFTVQVIHKPLLSNYWHFEFKVLDNLMTEIITANSAWKKQICSSISSKVQEIAIFNIPLKSQIRNLSFTSP